MLRFAVVILSLSFLFAVVDDVAAADKAEFRAGAATSNITPPIGLPIIGGFSPAPSTHIHDELNARCLVLDDGRSKLALVVCDLLGVHKIVCDEACRLIKSGPEFHRRTS